MSSAGRWVIAAIPALALLVPATSVAKPITANTSAKKAQAKVRSISAPRQVVTGEEFTLTARVRNTSNRAVRPRLVVSLRKFRNGNGRVLASRAGGQAPARPQQVV